ncbi:hypothetical protein KBY58_09100 [Cyanobium sp. HWJ4-Hawea]|uniref:Npun_F0494 family protein n=1 Tax=unclassified Cyanobium TaxID=2627006 RepID=UPI0020CFCA0C|nr:MULTISPECIES: Npun_F0494 family protein [unclassified Cyanobium]MCP9775087.1 hypothetical protein [Cyanobium sp. WAJ14-Wanaka]MCP9809587.1 hypothetical protein [Cyanobium sp. HWJ4-Hawea]
MQHQSAPSVGDLLHDQRAIDRASLALRCLPYLRAFYGLVAGTALGSAELNQRPDARKLCPRPLAADRMEADWIWLIQLGVLRREVDGQGLTHRVRLTPMGRRVLQGWQGEIPRAGLLKSLRNAFRRHKPRW